MSETFKAGELVDLTIRGAKVVNSYPIHADGKTDVIVLAEYGQGDHRNVSVNLSAASVTVERVAPAEWPPQPGDLWRDKHDELWFAFTVPTDTVKDSVRMRAAKSGRWCDYMAVQIQDNAPWALVYREGGEGE